MRPSAARTGPAPADRCRPVTERVPPSGGGSWSCYVAAMIPHPHPTRLRVRALVASAAAAVSVLSAIGPASAGTAPTPDVQAAQTGDTVTVNADAYWLVSQDGTVHTFGGVASFGSLPAGVTATDLEPTRDDQGYWILGSNGIVYAFGTAVDFGGADTTVFGPGESVASLSVTLTGNGYWIFTNRGRVIPKGDAQAFGDLTSLTLQGPILSSIPTPTGLGYYMVASDGGVFAFGDAAFHGSTGGLRLNSPVVGLTPDPDGAGYWLVAADGGLFAFNAPFAGSLPAILAPGQALNAAIIGAVRYGNAYLMVASDGGVFNFATDLGFQGSLGGQNLGSPIIGLAPANGTVVGSGDIRVTATWQNTNDVDLWVVTPANERIYYGAESDPTGGDLDVDSNAGCVGNLTTRPVENVFWSTGEAVAGNYTVYANLFEVCGQNPAATTVTISVTVKDVTVFSGQVVVDTANPADAFPQAKQVTQFSFS
jgi:hypothetical protein